MKKLTCTKSNYPDYLQEENFCQEKKIITIIMKLDSTIIIFSKLYHFTGFYVYFDLLENFYKHIEDDF